MSRRSASFTEAAIRKLIRAARAEGWTEVRISTPAGEAVLSSGATAAKTEASADDFDWEAFDRGDI